MSQSNYLLSIIIPAFNSENYISECLESLLPVLNRDVEIIIVNDGSFDGTGTIIDRYNSLNDNIKVLNQVNSGVSVARNNGLQIATGTFVTFVDSDDYIDAIELNKLLDYIQTHLSTELVIFPNYRGNEVDGYCLENFLFENREYTELDDLYFETVAQHLNEPWKKIYRRDYIELNNINFPNQICVGEDICFFLRYLYFVESFVYIDAPFYYYRLNPNSVCANVKLSYINLAYEVYKEMKNFIGVKGLSSRYIGINEKLFLHIVTRDVQSLSKSKTKMEIKTTINKSGVIDELYKVTFPNITDKVRRFLLLNGCYKILTLILDFFPGK